MQDHIKKVVDDIVQASHLSPKESRELRCELMNHCDLRYKELASASQPPEKIHDAVNRSLGNSQRVGNEFLAINYEQFLIRLGAVSVVLMLLAIASAFAVWFLVIRSL